jgi:ABC-2 type transport system ATP-binding protein
MRRRLDLAASLVARPQVIFLDEPTTGLDPRSRLGMWDVIRDLVREGATLLLTTQYLEEADALADDIAIIDRGKVIAQGTADELKAQVGGERVELVVSDRSQLAKAADALRGVAADTPVVDEGSHMVTVRITGGTRALADVVRELDAAGVEAQDLALRRPTLDEVFLSLTGHAADEEEQR